jgi:hypothetical protein
MATAPTPTDLTAARKSRASRGTAQAAKDAAPKPDGTQVPSATPPATPASEVPKPKPTATLDTGARPVTYWFPSITLASGEKVACAHTKYGHESEASAAKCGRSLASAQGVKIA